MAVALDGDLALVGSPGDDTEGTNAGAAYLFARTEGGTDGWGEVIKLVAADAAAGDLFGIAVDIDGDYAVVAAPSEDGAGTDRGAVYIFHKDQGGANAWGQVARLRASDAANGDDFGASVAIDGTTVVVGAEGVAGDTTKEGAAYVFLKDQGGLDYWGLAAKLVSDDPGNTDQYGYSVALSGDIAVIGAPGENGSGENRGAVRVYARDLGGANAWGMVKRIKRLRRVRRLLVRHLGRYPGDPPRRRGALGRRRRDQPRCGLSSRQGRGRRRRLGSRSSS